MRHLNKEELEAGLEEIRRSPKDDGILRLIVRRPKVGGRETVTEAELTPEVGLVGDNWSVRKPSSTPGEWAHADTQINVMNVRVVALVAQEEGRWPLAGDQLFVDFDLSDDNLPPGSRLGIGTAVIQVSAKPHTGCDKFVERFGVEAMKFVNSDLGRALKLRGINAKVVQSGTIRIGDMARKIS
jgi:MOSC domain-containing protein YiiM